MSVVEDALANLAGGSTTLPEQPQSRVEKILYKKLGYDVEVESPISRVEDLLMQVLDVDPPSPSGGNSSNVVGTGEAGYMTLKS